MNNLCAVCNQPMKQIPAGVSRSTGRPYGAFMACEDKTHKQPQTPRAYQAPAQQSIPQGASRDFNKEARGKIRHGLFCSFIEGKTMESIMKDMPSFKLQLMDWENTIMNGVRQQHENDFIQSLEEEYPVVEFPQ